MSSRIVPLAAGAWTARRVGELVVLDGVRTGRQLDLLVGSGNRVLELPESVAQRSPSLGDALWPEKNERDDQDEDQVCGLQQSRQQGISPLAFGVWRLAFGDRPRPVCRGRSRSRDGR